MWEDAAPMQEREPPRPPARPRSEEDLVLWAQILLCLAAVGFVLAAKLLGWPAYPVLLFMRGAGYSYGGYWFACCNLLVGGSNLLPLPGLDGWRIAGALHGIGRT